MQRTDYRAQLPFLFRIFAFYAEIIFKNSKLDVLPGGRKFFLFIVRINKFWKIKDYAEINLDKNKVCIDLTDPRFLKVINEFDANDSLPFLLETILKPGDTFLDIGANHGSFSVIASRVVGEEGLVIAVEAQNRLAYAISRSMELNSSAPYKIFNIAVGNSEGEIDFFIPDDTSGSAGLFKQHSARFNHKVNKVRIAKFDNLVEFNDIKGKVAIKLDIEGGELNFLLGAEKFISMFRPVLMMEINPDALAASGAELSTFHGLIRKLGYTSFSFVNEMATRHEIKFLPLSRFSNVILYPGN